MGRDEIIARILSDGEAESEKILLAAQAEGERILSEAKARAEELRGEAERDMREKAERILGGRAAAARLDCKKIELSEKRRVIDCIYELAYRSLLSMGERDTVALYEKLLVRYAEEDDEIVFDYEFNREENILALPVVKERRLTMCRERESFGGGLRLKGRVCDKDLSYRALLAEDRALHQGELSRALFRKS